MAAVIPLLPYRAWRERVRVVEEAVAAELARRERETGYRRSRFRPRLTVVRP